jgi:transcriptional regulator GlxA family with amidase domain
MAKISILAVEGGLNSSISTLSDSFLMAELWHQRLCGSNRTPLFETHILTIDGNPVEACGGSSIQPHRSIQRVTESDYVIISPFWLDKAKMPGHIGTLSGWLKGLMDQGATIAAVCTGSFILAETGLLDGRRATTNWQFVQTFQKLYPHVSLEPEHMLIKDGNIITTGAVTAVYSLIIHIVRELGSPELASVISKVLLIDTNRPDQTPYNVFSPNKGHGDSQVLRAQQFIEKKYAEIGSIEEIADEVGISLRHFIRRFQKATGDQPLKYLQRVRIDKARELLETTRDNVDQITWAVGYQDISSFGRLFRQYTGLSPSAYRERFFLPALG